MRNLGEALDPWLKNESLISLKVFQFMYSFLIYSPFVFLFELKKIGLPHHRQGVNLEGQQILKISNLNVSYVCMRNGSYSLC